MTSVVVYGANGHTGNFVVRELARRGLTPIPAGRRAGRIAHVDDTRALYRALAGAAAVINCAGPFLDTARPLALAALRAGIHYLDVAAEQHATRDLLAELADADVCVVPAAGFYGGLADVLATSVIGGDTAAAIDIRIALDRWWPTPGTRITGERNTTPRVVVAGGILAPLVASTSRWHFAAPFGVQDMVELPLSEIITLHHHLRAREIHTHLNLAPLADLRAAETPPPVAIDDSGRSAQRFAMEAIVTVDGDRRIARAAGRDIYAVTAPLVVEAVTRILDGRARRTGAAVLGELFDARDFLAAITPHLER